jgi:hypothetical protein
MMADDAVQNPADFVTTVKCDGCGEDLSLVNPHLLAVVKPQRAVIETMNTALVDAETDDEGNIVSLGRDLTVVSDELDGDTTTYYMGYKKGAGDLVYLHNYDCLSGWAQDKIADNQTEHGSPILRTLKEDPEAEGRGND